MSRDSWREFVAGSRWEDIPAGGAARGRARVLNFVGCCARRLRATRRWTLAVRVLTPFFGPAQATVIGRGERPDALNAAFLNAVSANVLEYDDTHLRTVMHPAAPVAPASVRAGRTAPGQPAAICCTR